jgi:hypothetical protein
VSAVKYELGSYIPEDDTDSSHLDDGGARFLRNIPENCILHSHRCENLKSYFFITMTGDGGGLLCYELEVRDFDS